MTPPLQLRGDCVEAAAAGASPSHWQAEISSATNFLTSVRGKNRLKASHGRQRGTDGQCVHQHVPRGGRTAVGGHAGG